MIVYQIKNKINLKSYIGITINKLSKRVNEHSKNKKSIIGKAIAKYGIENFNVIVLKDGIESKNKLRAFEVAFIKKIKPEYNATKGGDGIRNYRHSKETREKMSKAHKGKKLSSEHKEKISKVQKGKMRGPRSQSVKEKISKSHSGKILSEEHKASISHALRNKAR